MKKINTVSFDYKARVLLGGRKNYKECSDSSWVVSPQEKAISPRALFNLEDLDKITKVQDETSIDRERIRILGGERTHAPTIAYQLKDVRASNGNLYKGNMKYCLSGSRDKLLTDSIFEEIPSGCLSCSAMGAKYFGHWMRDDIPKYLASKEISLPLGYMSQITEHQKDYSSLFGINPKNYSSGRIRELTILEDYGQNSSKKDRYDLLRSKIQCKYPRSSKSGVMILRGSSGQQRGLINEVEVIDFLKRNNFDIVDPECNSVDDIISKCRVDILIGVEGSQLSHFNYSGNDHGAIITLQPPNRFNNVYKDYADCIEMTYGFVVGDAGDCGGFSIDISKLEKIIGLAVNKINSNS